MAKTIAKLWGLEGFSSLRVFYKTSIKVDGLSMHPDTYVLIYIYSYLNFANYCFQILCINGLYVN